MPFPADNMAIYNANTLRHVPRREITAREDKSSRQEGQSGGDSNPQATDFCNLETPILSPQNRHVTEQLGSKMMVSYPNMIHLTLLSWALWSGWEASS